MSDPTNQKQILEQQAEMDESSDDDRSVDGDNGMM